MYPGALRQSATLIATLGSEPQVVTVACDLLLKSGELIDTVAVIHTIAPGTAIEQAVDILRTAFIDQPYAGNVRLNLIPLLDDENCPIADVDSSTSSRIAFREIYRQVREAKLEGLRVHLSIAGGRKSMAVFGMAAAQLLFDEQDRLWHLFSSGDFLSSKRLHPEPGDEVHLIPIPVILWSQVSPVLTDLRQAQDPFEALGRIRQLQLRERLDQARAFVLGSLTAAERRVVELLVREGLAGQEIADRLVISPRTVEGQLRSAYLKAANHWELPDVGRAQLISLLNMYYSVRLDTAQNAGFPA
jgi:CRISPR-associated Csx14 family protein